MYNMKAEVGKRQCVSHNGVIHSISFGISTLSSEIHPSRVPIHYASSSASLRPLQSPPLEVPSPPTPKKSIPSLVCSDHAKRLIIVKLGYLSPSRTPPIKSQNPMYKRNFMLVVLVRWWEVVRLGSIRSACSLVSALLRSACSLLCSAAAVVAAAGETAMSGQVKKPRWSVQAYRSSESYSPSCSKLSPAEPLWLVARGTTPGVIAG